MSKEFRLSTTVTLPEDEFEQAATLIQCGKLKAAVMKLTEEHKLVAVVSHETVTPRERKAAATVPEVAAELLPATEAAPVNELAAMIGVDAAPEPTPLHVRRGQHNAPSAA
jgi:hypothetical protein